MKQVITYNATMPAMPKGNGADYAQAYDYSAGAGMLTLFES